MSLTDHSLSDQFCVAKVRQQLRLVDWGLPAYLLLFSSCYLPVLLVPYAFPDDYSYLHASLTDPGFPNSAFPGLAAAGRPLCMLYWWFYSIFIRRIADFALLRLLGIVGVSLLAFLSLQNNANS